VVAPGTRGLTQIVAEFGLGILRDDGTLNRPKLGDIIFNDEIRRKKLNAIIHPAVRRAMLWSVFKCWIRGERLCVLDVPLLIEGGLWKWVGYVVVVFCSEQVQLDRLMKRDGSQEEAASARISSQMRIAEKVVYADFVLDNSGTLRDAEERVGTLVKRLQRQVSWLWWAEWLIPPLGILSASWTLIWRKLRTKKRR